MKFEDIDMVMKAIEQGEWSSYMNPVIPIGDPFENDAGQIWNIAWGTFASSSVIRSTAGAVRSNHHHRTDAHFIYVLSGLMYYYDRQADSNETPRRTRCKPGTLIYTPPLVEHATFFPLDTVVFTLNKRTRDHESHESDLVRMTHSMVTGEVCPAVMMGVKCCLPWQHVEGRGFTEPIHAGKHESIDNQVFSFNA